MLGKTSAAPEKSDKVVSRSTEIWFSDGNIVLQVEEGNSCVRFRIHTHALTHCSTFFRDLFALSQPDNDPSHLNEMDDGAPVVCLKGDAINDWSIILSALYDPFYFRIIKASHIRAMALLGKKYIFPKFLAEAEKILMIEYPTTLSEYRQIKANSTIPQCKVGLTMRLLLVAGEDELPSYILPALYYEGIKTCLNGIVSGSICGTDLSPKTQAALLAGRERLLRIQERNTSSWINGKDSCDNPQCTLRTVKDRRLMLRRAFPSCTGNPPLRPFLIWNDLYLRDSPCNKCKALVLEWLRTGAERVWEALPGCFGLPPWKELKADLDADNNLISSSPS